MRRLILHGILRMPIQDCQELFEMISHRNKFALGSPFSAAPVGAVFLFIPLVLIFSFMMTPHDCEIGTIK